MSPKAAITAFIKKITSWSFSRWNVYDQCPAKAKYQFIDKLPQPPSKNLERGTLIHKQAECFIKGQPAPMLTDPIPRLTMGGDWVDVKKVKFHKLGVLPPELKSFEEYFQFLARRYKNKLSAMAVETTWAFRADWSHTTFDDWKGCVLRVKVDCAYEEDGILYIDDWKSGKYNADLAEEYKKALQLYTLGGFMWYPHIKKIRPRLRYTDMGASWPEEGEILEYDRADIPKLKELWLKRTRPMLNDIQFAPKPNSKCRFCPFSSKFVDWETKKPMSPVGPCEF